MSSNGVEERLDRVFENMGALRQVVTMQGSEIQKISHSQKMPPGYWEALEADVKLVATNLKEARERLDKFNKDLLRLDSEVMNLRDGVTSGMRIMAERVSALEHRLNRQPEESEYDKLPFATINDLWDVLYQTAKDVLELRTGEPGYTSRQGLKQVVSYATNSLWGADYRTPYKIKHMRDSTLRGLPHIGPKGARIVRSAFPPENGE